MLSYTDFNPTPAEVMDAIAAFVIALSAHLPEEMVNQMSASLEHTTARMRLDGKERAATLASALSAAIHVPFRGDTGDH